MSSESDANRAIAQLNGVELKGRALTVNEARPKAWQGVPRMRPVEVPAPPSADETRTHGLDTGGAKIQIAATGAHTFDLDAIENRTVDIGGIEAHAVDLDGIVTVTARAIEIFGTREKAIRWLRTPLPPLSDRTPLSMLNTAEGIERIEEVLGRIEQGVW
jgi:hypothetical protein